VEIGEENVYIPNSFTPNGDGLNDELAVFGFGFSDLQMTVYDRWGRLIFKSNGDQQSWDGKIYGRLAEPDNYTLIVFTIL
jgi:trimeric autotransporter adhesin